MADRRRYKNVQYSKRNGSSRSSSVTSLGSAPPNINEFSVGYAQVLSDIDRLSKFSGLETTNPLVAEQMVAFRNNYLTLTHEEQLKVGNYLKTNYCNTMKNVVPGTVGASLCGCYLNPTSYGNQPAGCTIGCIGNDFSSQQPCNDTVLFIGNDREGNVFSQVINKGAGTCRVNIDPTIRGLTLAQRDQFIKEAGCSSATFYNANTNQPLATMINGKNYANPSGITPTVRTPDASATSQGSGLWWIFALFFFFILIGIIYVACRPC